MVCPLEKLEDMRDRNMCVTFTLSLGIVLKSTSPRFLAQSLCDLSFFQNSFHQPPILGAFL